MNNGIDLKQKLKDQSPKLYDALEDIRKFADRVWKDRLLPWFTNHNCENSEEIIFLLCQILKPMDNRPEFLDENELFILLSAAYLHDIGMQYLKIDEFPIERLTEVEYDLVRKRHAEESFNIILKRAMNLEPYDFRLPESLHMEYVAPIAWVSKGHSTDYFADVIKHVQETPFSPMNRRIRADLLTALLMIADELDLQCKRVDFSETAKFNLSPFSKVHWFKHHYVSAVTVNGGTIEITLMFPQNADGYQDLIRELIEKKLAEQVVKVNPILVSSTSRCLRLQEQIDIRVIRDDTGAMKQELPPEVLDEIKKVLKKDIRQKQLTPPRAIPNPASNIPKPSEIFTGRKEELKQFKTAFANSAFLSIEGLGGIGKTEFAAKCIEELINKDRVVWFDCYPESKLDDLIAHSGYEDVLKGETKTELAKYSGFTSLIERDEKVIFLDNFQDILDNSFKEFFRFAERRLQKARMVLIARENPDAGINTVPIQIDGLQDDALDYAQKRLSTRFPHLNISPNELKNICDELNGHPFAIDFALQLLNYGEPPRDILSKITTSGEKADELGRRLLDEVFTHPKSTEKERAFMLRFSVFRGEVNRDGIEQVMDRSDITETLYALIDKKMVEPVRNRSGYYRTHPLIKEFCYRRLTDRSDAHLKAAIYYQASRTEAFSSSLEEEIFHHLTKGEHVDEAVEHIMETGESFIRSGHTNFLQMALGFLIDTGIERPEFHIFYGDIETIRGEWKKAKKSFEQAFSSHLSNDRIMAEAYIKFGEMLYRTGEIKESLRYFEDAQEICKNKKLQKELARCVNDIGLVNKTFGNLPLSIEKLNEGLKVRQEIGDREGIATSLRSIGNVLHGQGKYDKAMARYTESLKISEEIGDKVGIATSLGAIGDVLRVQGKYDKAMKKHSESLKISETTGDKAGIGASLDNIGNVLRAQGKYDEAMKKHTESLKIDEEIGNKAGISISLNNIGLGGCPRIANSHIKDLFINRPEDEQIS
jgi:tetratricopeptide (TPR) repeat protein